MHNIQIGPLRIEGGNRVFVDGRPIRLARHEQRLLLHVVGRRGEICLHQDLIGRGWDTPAEGDSAAVGKCINRLRRKLGRAARMLETIRGLGYRLTDGR
jgi:DNA-binding response OmpR family regulator